MLCRTFSRLAARVADRAANRLADRLANRAASRLGATVAACTTVCGEALTRIVAVRTGVALAAAAGEAGCYRTGNNGQNDSELFHWIYLQ